jgi:hypothetical protein
MEHSSEDEIRDDRYNDDRYDDDHGGLCSSRRLSISPRQGRSDDRNNDQQQQANENRDGHFSPPLILAVRRATFGAEFNCTDSRKNDTFNIRSHRRDLHDCGTNRQCAIA